MREGVTGSGDIKSKCIYCLKLLFTAGLSVIARHSVGEDQLVACLSPGRRHELSFQTASHDITIRGLAT